MNQMLELKQQRAALLTQASDLITKAATEKRGLNAEENEKYDRLFGGASDLQSVIDKAEQLAKIDSAFSEIRQQTKDATGAGPDKQVEAFNQWVRFGASDMTPEMRSQLAPANQNDPQFRAQGVGSAGIGGVMVPQGFYDKVMVALKFYGGMLDCGAFQLTTDSGQDIPWPTLNDTTISAAILGENTADTPTDIGAMSSITLKAWKYTSKMIQVSNELLQDNAVDLEALISQIMGTRFGRGLNTDMTLGAGTAGPKGVVVSAVSGKVGTTGQTLSVIYNDLVDLMFSLDRTYRQNNARWMMNDTSLKAILKLVDTAGRPLILDYTAGIKSGEPGQILGHSIVINNDVAVMAANAKSILFGDFSTYAIRRVAHMMSLRLTERYAEAGQVAFIGFLRADGRLIDAGTNPVKYYANSAT